MKYQYQKGNLYFYFYDDFDFMNIQAIKQEVIAIIDENKAKKVFFDFADISFIDSTGIGFVLARFKQLSAYQKELIVCNLSKENKIIFEMSGVFLIIKHMDNEVKL